MTWDSVRLQDMGTWFGGGTPSKSNSAFWTDGEVPWLSPKDMGREVLTSTKDHVTEAAVRGSSTKLVPANSVAVVTRSGILERTFPVAVVPFATTINQDMKAVVPREGIDPRWIAWGLRAHERELLRVTRKAGTTVASIEMRRFYDFELPVPPLVEQRRIVALLEDHLSRLDAADLNVAVNTTRLDHLRQSVVDDAFARMSNTGSWEFFDLLRESRCHKAGSLKFPARPDVELLGERVDWPIASLEEVTDPARVVRYGILKPASESGDVPYVEVRDLRNGHLSAAHLKRTSSTLDQQFAGARLRCGDVVVAVRGSFERSAVVPADLEGANISRDVVRLAPLPGMNPAYLCHWYETSTTKRYLRHHARGVAVRGVNVGTLRALPVPVVAREVQDSVVAQIAEGLAALDRLRMSLEHCRRRSAALRRSLLAAAFSGKLTSGSETTISEELQHV